MSEGGGWFTMGQIPRAIGVAVTGGSAILLWRPWITAGAVEERVSQSAFWFMPLGISMLLLTLGAAVSIAATAARPDSLGWVPPLLGAAAMLPGLVLIIAVEFAQSLVPTALTPVLTNSEFLTLRAEYGAWGHVGMIASGLTLWSVSSSMTRGDDLVSPGRAAGRILLLLTAVAIPVIRSLPLFRVTVSSESLELGASPLAVVEVVPGEIPVIGVISTFAVLGFVVLALVAVVRPNHLALIGASAALGTHLAIIWVEITIASIANGVIPDNWSGLLGDWAAIDIATLHTSTATVIASCFGFAACLLLAQGQMSYTRASRGWSDSKSVNGKSQPDTMTQPGYRPEVLP